MRYAPIWVVGAHKLAHLSDDGGRSTVCGAVFARDFLVDIHRATGDADSRCQACHDTWERARVAVERHRAGLPPLPQEEQGDQ